MKRIIIRAIRTKLFSNFSWLFAGSVAKIIMRLTASLYLARMLGPLGLGQLSLAQAVLAYFILFIDCGLEASGTREIAMASKNKNQIVGKILTIRLVLIIVSMMILLTFAPFFTTSTATKNILILFSFVLIPIGLNLAWVFRGVEQMKIVAVSDLIQITLYLALIILLVKSPSQILIIPIIFTISYVVFSLYLLKNYIHQWGLPKLYISIKDNWKFLRSAIPAITILFFLQIYYNLDTLMLGFYRGEKEVGIYNAAYRVIMGIITLSTVLMEATYPRFSKLYRERPFEVSKLLKKTLGISIAITIPMAIGGTILSRPIMVILFGSAFSDSKVAFQILIWSAMIALLAANYSYSLVACHQQKALAISIGIGTAFNIVLNFLLIPSQGILGASLATVIAQVVMIIFQIIIFAKKVSLTLPSAKFSLKALIAGLSMGLFIIYFNSLINFFIMIAVSIVIYFTILYLLGGASLFKETSSSRE